MIILTSPAKTFSSNPQIPSIKFTSPQFLDKSKKLNNWLKSLNKTELQKYLKISSKLADLNLQRNNEWKISHTLNNSIPAIYTYQGDVYQQLNLSDYATSNLHYAQKNLKIISGFYGLLRPLDLIQKYRLEMNTPYPNKIKSLYNFWQECLTSHLNSEIKTHSHKHVVNLASKAYSDSINFKQLTIPVVNIKFNENKNNKLRIIGLYAKKARGQMLDYLIKNEVEDIKRIQLFKESHYEYKPELSDTNNITFVRQH